MSVIEGSMHVVKDEPQQEDAEINSSCEETAIKIEPVEPKQEEKLNFFFTKQELQVNEDFYDSHTGRPLKLELNDSTISSNDKLLNSLQRLTRNSTNSLSYHIKQHPKCHYCNYTTKWKGDLASHVKVHHGSEEFKCTHCKYVTKWKQNLLPHVQVHHSSEQLKCDKCNFSTKVSRYLARHVKMHDSSNHFACTQCNYVTKWKQSLSLHLRMHHSSDKFKCTQCSYLTQRKSCLSTHIKQYHGSESK